jgi:predicted ATPase
MLLAQVEGLSARQPVLMVSEDVHWSDPTTITRSAGRSCGDAAGLVIMTFRPEFTPPWVGRPHMSLLALSGLPPADIGIGI